MGYICITEKTEMNWKLYFQKNGTVLESGWKASFNKFSEIQEKWRTLKWTRIMNSESENDVCTINFDDHTATPYLLNSNTRSFWLFRANSIWKCFVFFSWQCENSRVGIQHLHAKNTSVLKRVEFSFITLARLINQER